MRLIGLALLACVAGCSGCDDPQATPDAPPDTPPDTPPDGPCGADRFLTGELVDFDSSDTQFQGVFNARLTVEGAPARTATTAPNGRFELCAPPAAVVTLDVDAPGDYLDGKAYLEAERLGGTPVSFRALTPTRASSLYTFDPARGHVLVYLAGDRYGVALGRAHDPALAGNDDTSGAFTWTPGDTGRYVLFPNVDVSSPTITLDPEAGPSHEIPVAAGRLTLVALYFVFL